MQAMLESVVSGARHEDIEGVEVVVRPALSATAVDALEADGYLLGTPANLGYMSGALKHFFDTIYYPVLEATQKRPFAAYVHGNEGVEGAVRAIGTVTTGLQWMQVAEPVTVMGEPSKEDLDACWELGATVAAGLM
jgi:multimeric flavodoxin WrbA